MTTKLTTEEKAARKAQRTLERKRRQIDRSWEPTFLYILGETGSVKYACQQAHISRTTAYSHKDQFPDFAAQWEEAKADALDSLIAQARARAIAGSDLLLMFLIKQGDPTYRDNYTIEHTTPADRPLQITTTDQQKARDEIAQWRAEQKELLAALLASGQPMPPPSL